MTTGQPIAKPFSAPWGFTRDGVALSLEDRRGVTENPVFLRAVVDGKGAWARAFDRVVPRSWRSALAVGGAGAAYGLAAHGLVSHGLAPHGAPRSLALAADDGTTAAPANLTATATGAAEIRLAWDAVESATSYHVLRGSSADGSLTEIATTGGTSALDAGLTPGTTYYYAVEADDGTTVSPDATLPPATASLATPSGLTATATGAARRPPG